MSEHPKPPACHNSSERWILLSLAAAAFVCAGAAIIRRGRQQLRRVKPPPLRATILSQPAGATIRLDGRRVGRTPLFEIPVQAGEHELLLQKPGYKPYRVRIYAAKKDETYSARLKPAGRARLEITSTPPGAKAYVDGAPAGETPAAVGELTPGEHLVRVLGPNGEAWEQTVRVAAGQTARAHADMKQAAIQRLKDRLAERPGDFESAARLAEELLAAGLAEDAETALAGAWRLALERPWTDAVYKELRRTLAAAYARPPGDRRHGEAMRALVERQLAAALKQRPQDGRLIRFAENVLSSAPGRPPAAWVFEQLLRRSPENAVACAALARLYLRGRRIQDAARALQQAERCAGRDWRLWRTIAQTYEDAGQQAAAKRLLKKCLLYCDDAAERARIRSRLKRME